MLEITPFIQIPDDQLQFTYTRSPGPGGQNVNKVNSKAILHWDVVRSGSLPEDVKSRFLSRYRARITTLGQVVVSGHRFRDQSRNAEDCRERLREMILAVLIPVAPRKPTKKSRSSVERRLQQKQQQSERKALRKKPTRFHEADD